MITHLRPYNEYEELYDKITIELCRDREDILRNLYQKAKKNGFAEFKDVDDPEDQAVRLYNMIHYFQVELLTGERWRRKTETIKDWMDQDEAKDNKLKEARLTVEPKCKHCGKVGLRIISKDMMSSDEGSSEDVLFMLECNSCNKRTATWSDGTLWTAKPILCPKCSYKMEDVSKRNSKVITDTYTCLRCSHSYKEVLDLNENSEEEPDQYWEEDKARFVISDKKGQELVESMAHLESLARLTKDAREKEVNKELYEAVAKLKKVNIGQLKDVLAPAIEKAGYYDFTLDKPEMGRDVFVGFSCLDSKSDREGYDSRKTLKKTTEKALEDTNWRLMSGGVSYRLGYLSGRVRAYEKEVDLINLVSKNKTPIVPRP